MTTTVPQALLLLFRYCIFNWPTLSFCPIETPSKPPTIQSHPFASALIYAADKSEY